MKTNPDNILRLKYRLEPKRNGRIDFKILEQDEALRNKGAYIDFGKHNGLQIYSDSSPDIWEKSLTICLRGSVVMRDNDVIVFTVKSQKKAMKRIHKALELFIKSKYGHCKRIEE